MRSRRTPAPGLDREARANKWAMGAAVLGVTAALAAGLLLIRGGGELGERSQDVAEQAASPTGGRLDLQQVYALPDGEGLRLQMYLTPAAGTDAFDLRTLDIEAGGSTYRLADAAHAGGTVVLTVERDADGSMGTEPVLTAGDLVRLELRIAHPEKDTLRVTLDAGGKTPAAAADLHLPPPGATGIAPVELVPLDLDAVDALP